MSTDDARCAALLALGGITQIEQQCRDARGRNFIENTIQDLRYGVSSTVPQPRIFHPRNSLPDPGHWRERRSLQLGRGNLISSVPGGRSSGAACSLWQERREEKAERPKFPGRTSSILQRNCTLCDALFVSKITGSTLSIGDHAEVTTGSIVSANYFDAIGVRPILGRGFEPGEDIGSNAHPVVVISYDLWQKRFRGDPQIIGKMQRLNNVPHTIIGVAPERILWNLRGLGDEFLGPGLDGGNFESGGYKLEDRSARWIESYLRLKPGVTRAQAQA